MDFWTKEHEFSHPSGRPDTAHGYKISDADGARLFLEAALKRLASDKQASDPRCKIPNFVFLDEPRTKKQIDEETALINKHLCNDISLPKTTLNHHGWYIIPSTILFEKYAWSSRPKEEQGPIEWREISLQQAQACLSNATDKQKLQELMYSHMDSSERLFLVHVFH